MYIPYRKTVVSGKLMNWNFSHKGFLVCPEAWARRGDSGIRWFGAITLSKEGQTHAITLDDKLFDWPSNARRYAGEYAKQLIDAYVRRGAVAPDPMKIGLSSARPRRTYPPGPFEDVTSQF
jgi:hypothetical protein